MIDPATQLSFSVAENPGVYALFIGSGVSRAAEIPTGWEIILDLARRVAMTEGVEGEQDWAAWYRTRFGGEPNYSTLLDALSVTPAERRSILHNYIEPGEGDVEQGRRTPTRAHRAIARLVAAGFLRVIVTTNFDRLLEAALRELGVEPTVIRSVDDLVGAAPMVHNRCTILKVHGDYLDSRILNTDAELASYPTEVDALLDRIMDEYGLVVAGWSADWDPALRAAIMRAPNRRYPTFWAARGEPTAAARDIIEHRAAKLVPVADADSFFEAVQRSVDTLHRTRRLHPDAIGLVLASTKRLLARPEHRIELNDLVVGQVRRVVDGLVEARLPVQVPDVDWDIAAERWDAIEALAEPLARAMGLMGRWGDGGDVELAQGVLGALREQPGVAGNSVLVSLRHYPAYLCFLTYALGLTAAGRFDDLHRWFGLNVARPGDERRPAASHLFMSFWDEAEPDWWKHRAPEYERRKTAWADYLVDHAVPWSADYGLSPGQALHNYNVTELLGGFAAMGSHEAGYLASLNEFTWMPYGRLMRAEADRAATLARLEDPALHGRLLAAGFSNGSQAHWDGVKRNIGLLARRVGW